jgi:L-lactate dehydrogenase (cytochrome)
MIGEKVSLPLALAPVGLPGLIHGDGEILACRAAQAVGIPFTMSTPSICSIEDVAAAVDKPFWFQLYVMKDRGFTRSLIERAAAARCTALVLTVDLPMMSQRHVDIRNGLTVPPSLTIKNLVEMARKPRWTLSILAGKRRTLGNFDGYVKDLEGIKSVAQWVGSQFDQTLSWKDVEWIRNVWPGKLIIKGILDVEDARLAAKTGATALVVSNHGGRQLDGTVSSISMLPKVVDAVGSEIEVLFDGGIRAGQDVLRALALGAKGCMIGRAYIYGLGAGGQSGVAKAIDIIKRELEFSMALTGVKRIDEIGRHILAQ